MASFIKEITLSGFKSFADKTTLQLKDGLNMIVGPNGCGKSNIVDAFSWAFGETQVKNLRSSLGTDVIFAGTEKRSGSFLAKVTFTIDNRNGLLNYESPFVSIKRQINKDNESEFFINNVSCRLKDIQQLFLDTGLGKNTYSILQQGRVDQIVTGKPEDRRILIEEAAGIRNTKLVIKESQSKLNKTNDNLIRLEDILKEVYIQYEVLKEQAQKAINFRNLKAQIQKHEKEVFYLRLNWVRYREEYFQSDINTLEGQIKVTEEKLAELENLKPLSEEDLLILQDKQEIFQKQKNDLLITEAQLMQKIELWKKEYQNLSERITTSTQKKQIFYNLTQEKETLAKDLSQKIALFQSPKQELEEQKDYLTKQQEILTVQEIEYQNLLSHYLVAEENIEKQALKKILEQIALERVNYQSLKSQQEFLYKEQQSLLRILQESIKSSVKGKPEELESLIKQLALEYQSLLDITVQIQQNSFSLLHFMEKENTLLKQYVQNVNSDNTHIEFKQKCQEQELKLEQQREIVQTLRDRIMILEKQNQSFSDDYLKDQIQKEKYQQESEFYKNSVFEINQDIIDLQLKQEEYQEYMDEAFLEYEKILSQKEEYEKEWQMYEHEHKKLEEGVKSRQKEENILRKTWSTLKEKFQKINIEKKEIEIERKLLLEEFTGRYLKFKEEEFIEYQTREGLLSLEQKDLHIKFQNLQNQIQKDKETLAGLGLVNFLAIDEFEAIEKRYHFLNQNKQDIENSQKDLLSLIADLQKESEKSFLNVFEQVNEHLKEIFSIAFNGGTCQMKLLNPDSLLDSGVEIIAQPPGKKLQNLNLLSGGEKTMVALSILFSLFMVKPAPFCLMDEVDAALDEMNIERFLRILNRFKEKVQFMIITHNRSTAQKGDVFYGVTMQETGISKVFSFLPDNKEI